MMDRTRMVITLIVLLIFNCEESDTTPPTISVIAPQNSEIVSETCEISVMVIDDDEVDKVELWINGENTHIVDYSEPYFLEWNTTTYENLSTFILVVRAYDINGNIADSEQISVIVDNTDSYPQAVSINSIIFNGVSFDISWVTPSEADLHFVELERSVSSNMSGSTVVYSSDSVGISHYQDDISDPSVEHFYRVNVEDIYNYKTLGNIASTMLDPDPMPVNVIQVSYTPEEMHVEWESSEDIDFGSYQILHSETELGQRSFVSEIRDQAVNTYTVTGYNPGVENWFWVDVVDMLGQSTTGNGGSNSIEPPPISSTLERIQYSSGEFSLAWSENSDADFLKYVVVEANSIDMSNSRIAYSTFDKEETGYAVQGVNQNVIKYYKVVTQDQYGVESSSNIQQAESYDDYFVQRLGGSGQDFGVSIDVNAAGKYLVLANSNSPEIGGGESWVITIDGDGNRLDDQNITGIGVGRRIGTTGDGGAIIAGNLAGDVTISKLSSSNEISWHNVIDGGGFEYCNAIEVISDGFILGGSVGGANQNNLGETWLAKYDTEGVEVWSSPGWLGTHSIINDITIEGGGIFSAGTFDRDKMVLIAYSGDGDAGWARSQNGYHGHVVFRLDDGFFLAGEGGYTSSRLLYIRKTDAQGYNIWNDMVEQIFTGTTVGGLALEDGCFIVAGTSVQGNGDFYLAKINESGSLQWDRHYGGEGYEEFGAICQSSDGGFVLIGSTTSYGEGDADVWVIKTDSEGNTLPGF